MARFLTYEFMKFRAQAVAEFPSQKSERSFLLSPAHFHDLSEHFLFKILFPFQDLSLSSLVQHRKAFLEFDLTDLLHGLHSLSESSENEFVLLIDDFSEVSDGYGFFMFFTVCRTCF